MKNLSPIDKANEVTQLRDQSRLAKLYPQPKNDLKRQQDDNRRQEMFRARLPKHVIISTGISLYLLWAFVALGISYIPMLILSNTIAGVFQTFLFALVVLSLFYWCYGAIADRFYKLDTSGSQILTVYTLGAVPLLSAFLYETMQNTPEISINPLLVFVVSVVHFLMVYVVVVVLRSNMVSDRHKASWLGAVVFLAIAVAVLFIRFI
jgi:hypothetical protein